MIIWHVLIKTYLFNYLSLYIYACPGGGDLIDYMTEDEKREHLGEDVYNAQLKDDAKGSGNKGDLRARVQFVDLAGSERGMDRSDDSDIQTVLITLITLTTL